MTGSLINDRSSQLKASKNADYREDQDELRWERVSVNSRKSNETHRTDGATSQPCGSCSTVTDTFRQGRNKIGLERNAPLKSTLANQIAQTDILPQDIVRPRSDKSGGHAR